MITRNQAEDVVIQQMPLVASGKDYGPVRRIFLDDYTGWPSFCTVQASYSPATAAGAKVPQSVEVFIALHEAELIDGRLEVPYLATIIDGAPQVSADGILSPQAEDDLFEYYGVPIDGVVPIVAHLGSLLRAADGDVVEHEL